MNKYVCPRYTRTDMYAGRVECCHLVRHAEYAPTGQMDGQTDRYIMLSARHGKRSKLIME